MDANGKPMMSRELLQRLTAVDPPTVSAVGVSAQSSQPQSFAQRRRSEFDRKRVAAYRQSSLGAQHFRTEIDPVSHRRPSPTPSQPQDGPQRVETGQNRPSAGFQEPPSRRYDPYR